MATEEQTTQYLTAEEFAKHQGALQKRFDEMLQMIQASIGSQQAQSTPSAGAPPLEQEVAMLRKKIEQAEKLAAQEKERTRNVLLRAKLAEELQRAGVDQKHVPVAVGYLVDSQKSVGYADDSSTLTFKTDGVDGDFATGFKSWLKTDQAKIFIPPRGTVGSGSVPTVGASQAGNNGKSVRLGDRLAEFFSNS